MLQPAPSNSPLRQTAPGPAGRAPSAFDAAAAVRSLPDALRGELAAFEHLPIAAQARVLGELSAQGLPADLLLRHLAFERKHADPAYVGVKYDNRRDATIYRVMRGHEIEIVAEGSDTGMSRAQAKFLEQVFEHAAKNPAGISVNSLNLSHADIQARGISAGSCGLQHRERPDPEADKIVPFHGIPGLLELLARDPGHPAFGSAEEAHAAFLAARPTQYSTEYVRGIVVEPPGYSNDGVLTLRTADGATVEREMCNLRLVNILGADTAELLQRGADEAYLGRPVRVWFESRWVKGHIHSPDDYGGTVTIIADAKIHSNERFQGGRGLLVSKHSIDLDLRDPETTAEREHPLAKHPEIRLNAPVRVSEGGSHGWGWIENIDAGDGVMQLRESGCSTALFKFGDPAVTVLPQDAVHPDEPLLSRGNLIARYDFARQKTDVFRIKGIDLEQGKAFGEYESLRPSLAPHCNVFDIDVLLHGDQRFLKLVNGDASAVIAAVPGLSDWQPYSQIHEIEFIDEYGAHRIGHVMTLETLPVYAEVIIEKSDAELERERMAHPDEQLDMYHRFDVPPERLVALRKKPIKEE